MSTAKDVYKKAMELSPGNSLEISNLSFNKLNNFRVALYRAKTELNDTTITISSNKTTITLRKPTQEELNEKEFDSIVIKEIKNNEFVLQEDAIIYSQPSVQPKKALPKKPGQEELDRAQEKYLYHQKKMTLFAKNTNLKEQEQDSADKILYSEMQGELDKLGKIVRELKKEYGIEYTPIPATQEELDEQEREFTFQALKEEKQNKEYVQGRIAVRNHTKSMLNNYFDD